MDDGLEMLLPEGANAGVRVLTETFRVDGGVEKEGMRRWMRS